MAGIKRYIAAPLLLVAVLAGWQIFVHITEAPEFILPSPTAIVASFFENVAILAEHALFTMRTAALGFLLGSCTGLLLAVAMAIGPAIRAAIYPIVIASQTTPKIAIAPLLIVWFGVGVLPKVLIVALLTFFPVLINTLAGLDSTDRGHLDLLRSVDASKWQTYRDVRIPSAVPYIFAGLKLALTISVIGAIVAEWVASNQGLGFLLLFYNARLQTTPLFAVLLGLLIVASTAFGLLMLIERSLSWEKRITSSAATATTTDVGAPPTAESGL